MLSLGSVPRERLAVDFPYLAERYPGRRNAIKALTHAQPDFVFWIYPDGRLHDARDAHARNVPKGHAHILDDEPDYGGFLRGRLVSANGWQLVVVYCRAEALAVAGGPLDQLLRGLAALPVPLSSQAVVISDNADLYGTVADLQDRQSGERRMQHERT